MILTEQFECRIPATSAIKKDTIFCEGTAPDNYLVLGDVATWITAIGTLLLFFGAWRAWRAATKTLKHMEKDSEATQQRHEESIRVQKLAEADRIRNGALFELLGVYAELDGAAGTNYETVLGISHRLKVAEQRFVMVNEYPNYPIALSDYHDTLLGAAFSSGNPDLREFGAMSAYRRLSGAKQRTFREFYKGTLGPEELVANLRVLVEQLVPENPEFYPFHIVDEYM